eukprot:SAG31_NODE_20704_length_567_cov_1.160256_2_plen_57_part_01
MLEAPKHTGQSAADSDEKCYDWSSIFPTPRIGQCHTVVNTPMRTASDISDSVGVQDV